MGNRRPMPGEKYRHFKNKLYQILAIAKHSETGEELVIYQALYDDFGIYARPLEMFVSEVDHEKYPTVTQRFRFTKADGSEEGVEDGVKEGVKEAVADETTEPVSVGADEVHPKLMDFLDADDMESRYKILCEMKDVVDDNMIDSMAVVCDVVIPEGPLVKRYDDLKYAIATRQKYEMAGRLR
ncbi:MAG: DUF1653 domain-containing protein [Lachnospiraceae bacterium]|nr:DUF1653 domain-containing protein [Lachnospiraceae bacterium]